MSAAKRAALSSAHAVLALRERAGRGNEAGGQRGRPARQRVALQHHAVDARIASISAAVSPQAPPPTMATGTCTSASTCAARRMVTRRLCVMRAMR
jgi:hypothetical protein